MNENYGTLVIIIKKMYVVAINGLIIFSGGNGRCY